MKNYKLINDEYIKDVDSEVKVYEHIKTKAKVLTLSNKDENKAFSISFRTIPKDSKGAAHIVEHCVLSGSRKYKTKEPFMDMIRGSMQTFLNAMTYPDKTMYPVSSRNKKDLYNLMDVYLDAVFYPLMREKEEIFKQEGWHYELEDKSSPLIYNGVVYNEMKGVYSDPQNLISDLICLNLHKDSSYGVDSGGNPKDIPSLTYEEFLSFHKKFYHPSNSYIYLYGDLDMEEALSFIDENYLKHFDYKDIDSKIILNEAFKEPKHIKGSFDADEDKKNRDYLAYSWCMGTADNKLDSFMQNFLIELLVNSDSAPLKMALLKKNLAEDIYAEGSSSLALDFSIIAKNTDASRAEEFKNTIFSSLKDLVKNGVNKDLLEATLNKFEFAFREGGGALKAIIYNIRAMNSWLYDKSPLDSLKTDDLIKQLRESINTDFVERYIEKKLLNNSYALLLEARPEVGKSKKEALELSNKLEAYKKSLSDSEINNLIKKTKELFDFQLTEDSPEDKATIPTLEISDIKKEITHIPRQVIEEEDTTYLFNPQFTNGISYLTISFDTSHIKTEDLENLSLLSTLLGKLSTKNYSYSKLDSEIYKVIGSYSISPTSYEDYSNNKELKRRLNLNFSSLDINLKKSLDIISEILFKSELEDKDRIKEVLLMEKSSNESSILQSGHILMMETVRSYSSKQSSYNAKTGGLPYYFYTCDLLDRFEEKWEDFYKSIKKLLAESINRKGLVINFTGSEESFKENKKYLKEFVSSLPNKSYKAWDYEFKKEAKNQAFSMPSNVQYISKGYDLDSLKAKYNGTYSVLSNILSSTYLHDNIRAKGGAYGGGMKISRTDLATYSYRDPNLIKTVEVYNNIYKFVENLDMNKEDIKNFIIGTMNTFDPHLPPSGKGSLNFSRYMTGTSEEEVSKFKEEAINTELKDLKALAPLLKEAMEKNYICAIGGEEILKENKNLFKEIIKLNR
ncbi:insulinase family protein [Peptoniphilus catoniae]|uniref:insulinase family protein n=1 Tax=Peptoniphilus catoniae TaxID=1660341 RepID=UPI0010FF5F5C|nr:insulinase family protein [Peptoniphilus catoniae]